MSSDRLRANVLLKEYSLEVDLRDVGLFSEELASSVQDRPGDVMPLVGDYNDSIYSIHPSSPFSYSLNALPPFARSRF